jgi:stage III sporulation protein AH
MLKKENIGNINDESKLAWVKRLALNKWSMTFAVILVMLSAYLGLEQAGGVDDEVLYVSDTLPYEVQKVSVDSNGNGGGNIEVLQTEEQNNVNVQNVTNSPENADNTNDLDYAVNADDSDNADNTDNADNADSVQTGANGANSENAAKYSINSESDYFINYRLEREKARSRQLELLQELIDDEKTTSEVRSDAQAKVIAQAEAIEQELMLESIMVAKYGGEAAVFIQPEKVNVVLEMNPEKMSDSEAAKIAELVNNYTGIGYENVIVVLKE